VTAIDARKSIQRILSVSQDGEIGPKTIAALNAADKGTIGDVQEVLKVDPDGIMGPKSMQALGLVCTTPDDAPWPAAAQDAGSEVHSVIASSFADPADVRAFRECKANGGTDSFCFGKGDNGIGKWGDDCSAGSGLACALPPEYWQQFGDEARGKEVVITANGRTVTAKLLDTMPHLANIHNGAGIDLSPDTVEALGLTPPIMVPATWRWA
jgi:hypothetical protein